MRAYDIAFFIFLFNLVLSLFTTVAMFDQQPVQADPRYDGLFDVQGDNRITVNLTQPPINPPSPIDLNFGDLFRSLQLFAIMLSSASIGVIFLMNQIIPVPAIANMISGVIYIVYLVGVLQFLSNKNVKFFQ